MTIFASNRFLRGFRRSKSLKDDQDSPRHHRKPSTAVSLASTASESSRPSTSWADKPADWDPLRLHPPMTQARAPSAYPPRTSPRRIHFADDDAAVARETASPRRGRYSRGLRLASSSPSLYGDYDDYDDFDFGFEDQKAGRDSSASSSESYYFYDEPLAPPPPHAADRLARSAPTAASSSTQPASHQPEGAVVPRPHPEGFDGADNFLRRGDWKRRGIVFSQEVSLASQDETFELP